MSLSPPSQPEEEVPKEADDSPQDQHAQVPQDEITLLLQGLVQSAAQAGCLTRLAKHRKSIPDLPERLWQQPGAVASLMQCVEDAYQHVEEPSSWTKESTSRASGALAMFQVLIAHAPAREELLPVLPERVLPLLSAKEEDARASAVQTTGLGVIAAILKVNGQHCLGTDGREKVKTICESIIAQGPDHSRQVATYILRKLGQKARAKSGDCGEDSRCRSHEEGSDSRLQSNSLLVKDLKRYEPREHVVWGDFERIDDSGSETEISPWVSRRSQGQIIIYRIEMSSDEDA